MFLLLWETITGRNNEWLIVSLKFPFRGLREKIRPQESHGIIDIMKLVEKNISLKELKIMSSRMFGGMVKVVVDINKEIMVVDAPMHADEEQYFLTHGSKQDDLWGCNIYPELTGEDFIEFDSMINLRPRLNNFSRNIENEKIRQKVTTIIRKLVKV